ncbi:MAG: putative phosphatidylinositol alpha-mannosyltransferase [Acidimicrobiales bacterium]|nr:MAG: putative phosphatidylinositol alpha-mannosyltransferase [Acidimicrobiales bacterium]
MKIGLICPYSLTIPGGVQQQVLQLARTIRELGEEVLVVAPCDGPPPEPWVVSVGPSIPAAANGSVAPIAPDPQAQLRTISILGGERFDLLHLHEPFVPGPTLTSLLAKPAPIVGTFHAAGGSAAYRYLRPVLRLLDRRLDLRCAVSEEAKRMAGEVCDGEILVLFNGIDPEPFETAEPHPKEGPTVLFLGRHEPRKGLEVLLEACEQLPSQVHVWVAGEGPETERLRARYGGDARVEWLGVVSDRERAARLKAADVFCAPSLGSESFGVVLLEAMAAGTAVVATSISGYRQVATAGVDALLVRPGDPQELASAIGALLGDDELRRSLVAAGKLTVRRFAMDVLARRYVDIYHGLVSSVDGSPPRSSTAEA